MQLNANPRENPVVAEEVNVEQRRENQAVAGGADVEQRQSAAAQSAVAQAQARAEEDGYPVSFFYIHTFCSLLALYLISNSCNDNFNIILDRVLTPWRHAGCLAGYLAARTFKYSVSKGFLPPDDGGEVAKFLAEFSRTPESYESGRMLVKCFTLLSAAGYLFYKETKDRPYITPQWVLKETKKELTKGLTRAKKVCVSVGTKLSPRLFTKASKAARSASRSRSVPQHLD